MVETKFTEPYHPWQNYSEQGTGELNRIVKRYMRAFNVPDNRRGYCQQWCARVRNSLALRTERRYTGHKCISISLLAICRILQSKRNNPA